MKKILKKFDIEITIPAHGKQPTRKYPVTFRHLFTIFGYEFAILRMKHLDVDSTKQ